MGSLPQKEKTKENNHDKLPQLPTNGEGNIQKEIKREVTSS